MSLRSAFDKLLEVVELPDHVRKAVQDEVENDTDVPKEAIATDTTKEGE
jgi:hypothetical protein